MNIFKFELKSQFLNTVIFTAVIISVLISFQSGVYPIFSNSIDSFKDMLAGYPKAFLSAFGFDSETMFSFGGFFNLTYSYLTLIGAIMASALSITAFAREKRNKCTDFLLAKPRSRISIFSAKLLSVLVLIFFSNILTILISTVLYIKTDNFKNLIISLTGLFLTEIVFIAFGTIFAAVAKKIRSVSAAATAFGFGAFILSAIYGLLGDEKLRYITPLKYFNSAAVYSNGNFELKYAVFAAVITIICFSAAFYRFCRCDAHAV